MGFEQEPSVIQKGLMSRHGAQIYDRLQTMGQYYAPVAGNQDGSYLTMWSSGGLQFEVIFFFSALSQMLVDQSYWQSAIAAKPTAAVKAGARSQPLPVNIGFGA